MIPTTFPIFNRLPAEMRNLVWWHHYNDMNIEREAARRVIPDDVLALIPDDTPDDERQAAEDARQTRIDLYREARENNVYVEVRAQTYWVDLPATPDVVDDIGNVTEVGKTLRSVLRWVFTLSSPNALLPELRTLSAPKASKEAHNEYMMYSRNWFKCKEKGVRPSLTDGRTTTIPIHKNSVVFMDLVSYFTLLLYTFPFTARVHQADIIGIGPAISVRRLVGFEHLRHLGFVQETPERPDRAAILWEFLRSRLLVSWGQQVQLPGSVLQLATGPENDYLNAYSTLIPPASLLFYIAGDRDGVVGGRWDAVQGRRPADQRDTRDDRHNHLYAEDTYKDIWYLLGLTRLFDQIVGVDIDQEDYDNLLADIRLDIQEMDDLEDKPVADLTQADKDVLALKDRCRPM